MTRGKITLLHGFMGEPSDWDEVHAQLPEYDVLTPRIRPSTDWDTGIRRLVDQLPPRSILVGYSMGARLLLSAAISNPEVVEGLVFVSGNPGIDDAARAVRQQTDSQVADRIERQPRRDFLAWWYGQRIFESLSPRLLEAEIDRKMGYESSDWGEILRTYSVSMQPNFWHELPKVAFPVLAIAGQQDAKYVDIVTKMGKLPHVDSRIVPACGHIVHREQPHVFLHILREFLQSFSAPLKTPC